MSGQVLADDSIRDTIAGGIGDFLLWAGSSLTHHFGIAVIITLIVLALIVLVKIGMLIGPKKICFWCSGKGYRKSLLSGVHDCPVCHGDGTRYRMGMKK